MASDWPSPEELYSERLVLEPLRIRHAREMVAVLGDPGMYEFIGGEPPTEADLTARYARQTSRPDWLNWILRLRSTGEAVGTVQATLKDERTAELAWVVSSRFQGRGYAREGAAAALDWLRRNGVELFVAHIHPDHGASNAVARRLGFVSTGELKKGEIRWELLNRCQN
jgi:RimJ/RimL family protein N-acetyltransferase